MIPKDLRALFKKIFTMQFEDEPPYDHIITAIKKEIQKDIELDDDLQPVVHQFEWIRHGLV